MADLTIKINGDLKSYEDALKDAQGKTETLNSNLQSLSKTAGIAFAALTAQVGLSVAAFAGSQKASNELTVALENQGLEAEKVAKEYEAYATAIAKKTGLDDDDLIAAQATIQSMIGQQKVTHNLTAAIADLSQARGIDLKSAAELIGKGIQGHTAALGKLGIEIDAHLNKEQRTAEILKQVQQRFGGLAEAANQGLGGIRGLTTAFGEIEEALGKRFAPIVEIVIKNMTEFFTVISENDEVLDFITSLITAGAVVSGLGTILGVGGLAFLKFKAAMEAAKISTDAMSLATKGLVGATGIGLLVVGLTEVYLHWNTIWPKMLQIYQAFIGNVTALATGVGTILVGVFKGSYSKIQEGVEQTKGALSKGYNEIIADSAVVHKELTTQEKKALEEKRAILDEKDALADERRKDELQKEQLHQEELRLENDITVGKIREDSDEIINLKQQQLDTVKALELRQTDEIKDLLLKRKEQLAGLENFAQNEEKQRNAELHKYILDADSAFGNLSAENKKIFSAQNEKILRASVLTEDKIERDAALERAQLSIKQNNQLLKDEEQFGQAYAALSYIVHRAEVQNLRDATNELVSLSRSKNQALKEIGKAASITQITIDTAKGAQSVYANFQSAIPFPPVSIPLGIAAAAAVIAYGAERISNVTSAAQGGLITGGIPNVDSVPAVLTPGELVVPQSNFEEVVGAVRDSRSPDEVGVPTQAQARVNVTVGFDTRTASQLLTILQIEDDALGISPRGAA